MNDIVSEHFEVVSNLIANSPDKQVPIEVTREMVVKTLQSEGLRGSEEEVLSPNWICMHENCRRKFENTNDFQRHLNESNHFNGRITKEVSKLCKIISPRDDP